MNILAIETSCDETAIAIIETSGPRRRPMIRIRSNLVSSQIKMHEGFGGVVPDLAKREHGRLLAPLMLRALKKAGMVRSTQLQTENAARVAELKKIFEKEPELCVLFQKKILPLNAPDIDAIAVTNGPGLAPALWVGVNFARALALIWGKPLMPVNHMKGHLFSALLQRGKENDRFSAETGKILPVRLPLLALLVSGGHTELVLMKKFGHYKIIGETLDDAAGEAFDKVARMLKLGYPGGPAIAAQAEMNFPFPISHFPIKLPRPMINSKDYHFSFSGLKTAVLYYLRDLPKGAQMASLVPALAKEFQNAVVDVLTIKTIRAAKHYDVQTVVIGGGVSANRLLRERLSREVAAQLPRADLLLPDTSLTGDNALMIAVAAALDGIKKAPDNVGAEANLRLDDKKHFAVPYDFFHTLSDDISSALGSGPG